MHRRGAVKKVRVEVEGQVSRWGQWESKTLSLIGRRAAVGENRDSSGSALLFLQHFSEFGVNCNFDGT